MANSKVAAATRAFVAVLLLSARHYEVVLEVNRDSCPELLVTAYKKVVLRAHPDKGGKKEYTKSLQAAREQWEKAHAKALQARPGAQAPALTKEPWLAGVAAKSTGSTAVKKVIIKS